MIDTLVLSGFLTPTEVDALVREMHESHAASAATISGGQQLGHAVDNSVRRVTRVAVRAATRDWISHLLILQKPALEQKFGTVLTHCEAPQFLRYETGDFFVAHQDGNTPLIHDHTRFRKVSVSIYLSQQSDTPSSGTYGDGELVLHGRYPHLDHKQKVVEAPGTLVAFRSETTHEVRPISHGTRYAVVSWFRSDEKPVTPP